LITDRQALSQYQSDPQLHTRPEQLLVQQDGEWVNLALFIAPEVLEQLHSTDPLEALHADNFEQFCIALEGVSHFLYLAWRAGFDRAVTLLELELQAEIDKYVSVLGLFARQSGGRIPCNLTRYLFDAVQFDASLTFESAQRYQAANHYARRYCLSLQERFSGELLNGAMLCELRRFYRMSQTDKIGRIVNGGTVSF